MKKILALALASILCFSSVSFADMEKRTVTKAEYLKNAEELFTRMDANKDGKLTVEERKTYWDGKKLERQQKKDLQKEPKKS